MSHRQANRPQLGRDVYIAPIAYVGGDVNIGDQTTIMHHVSIRGDVARIDIGSRVNIQDGAVVHTNSGDDLKIGDDVAVGHRAVVHCRSVGSGSLVGIGAVVLDGCTIGEGSIIAAGAVVSPGTAVPPRTVMMGIPARPVRGVTEAETAYIAAIVANYVELGRRHRDNEFPNIAERS